MSWVMRFKELKGNPDFFYSKVFSDKDMKIYWNCNKCNIYFCIQTYPRDNGVPVECDKCKDSFSVTVTPMED